MIFEDRTSAGRSLADLLRDKLDPQNRPILLAIPRGGIPVAHAVSTELNVPMGVLVVRKLGLPWNPEAGFGAIDPEGSIYVEEDTINYLGLDPDTISRIANEEFEELKKRERKFAPEGYPDLKGREVVVIDDGVATGYTAIAASGFARKRGSKKVIVAVPVCPADSYRRFKDYADEFLCYHPVQETSFAVGMFYKDFHQLSDEEAIHFIEDARQRGLLDP